MGIYIFMYLYIYSKALNLASNFHDEEIQLFHYYHEIKDIILIKISRFQLFTLE